jgi:hypothetical protein
VALISSGTSAEESGFLDASESGVDVFFLTAAKLSPGQDKDTALDVYDAHECSSQSPCLTAPSASTPPCLTEASCRPAPSAQPEIFGTAPSATFTGVGNVSPESPPLVKKAPPSNAQKLKGALRACKKAHKRAKKARAACERKAKARYGKAAGKKAAAKKKGGR